MHRSKLNRPTNTVVRVSRYILVSWLALVVMAACGGEKTESRTATLMINVKTEDSERKPVPTVRFFINGQKYGITLEDGQAKNIEYVANVGDTVTFDVEEPEGYRVPMAIDRSLWKHVVKDAAAQPVHFTVTFERPERDYVFVVDVEGGKQAVTLNGKKIGSTSENGEAILKVRGFPRQKFTATAGSVVLKDAVFGDGPEVYVVSSVSVGPVGKTTRLEATAMAVTTEAAVVKEKVAKIPTRPPSRIAKAKPRRPRRVKEKPRAAPRRSADIRQPRSRERSAARPRTRAKTGSSVVVGIPSKPPASIVTPPPRPVEKRKPAPVAKPAPVIAPRVVARVKPVAEDSAISDLLDDDTDEALPAAKSSVSRLATESEPPPKPIERSPPPPVVEKKQPAPPPVRARTPRGNDTLGDLIDDDSKTVDRDAVKKRVSISASAGSGSGRLGKEQVRARLADITERLKNSQVINRGDAEFLRTVSRKDRTSYYEANRILGHWYFKLKDYRRQAKALEEATRSGKYKHDPQILLSLAKAYGLQKKYSKAVRAMRRVESKMGRMRNKKLKSDAYRFYAEMLEFDFLRQYNDDAKEANYGLLNRAIRQWEKYRNFNRSVSTGAVREAEAKIAKLSKLKRELEY